MYMYRSPVIMRMHKCIVERNTPSPFNPLHCCCEQLVQSPLFSFFLHVSLSYHSRLSLREKPSRRDDGDISLQYPWDFTVANGMLLWLGYSLCPPPLPPNSPHRTTIFLPFFCDSKFAFTLCILPVLFYGYCRNSCTFVRGSGNLSLLGCGSMSDTGLPSFP